MLGQFNNKIAELFSQRSILFNLVYKHLKTKYAGSALGIFWALINPFLLAIVVCFVFTKILMMNIDNAFLFIISGMFPWAYLSASLQEAVVSIPMNSNLLKQFSLPREFIPISIVFSNFIIFMLGILVVLPLFFSAKTMGVGMLPLLLLAVILQSLFILGLSLIVSVIYVYFRDINQLLSVLLLFWLWLTPIFYSIEMIPLKYRVLFNLNPMTSFINLYRNAFFCNGDKTVQWITQSLILALISVCMGYALFILKEKDFLKRI